MLKIINEELFAFNPITVEENGKEYAKISICNTNKVIAYANQNSKNRNERNESRTAQVVKMSEDSRGELQTVKREICRVSAPAKMIGDFTAQALNEESVDFYGAMSSFIDYKNQYRPEVEIRCHEKGEDKSNIYVVAFPFNGKIQPLKEDKRYRIYKGVLVTSSAKPFYFNSRRYRKILYLVIEINTSLFDPSHKYHTDSIDIKFNSAVLRTDRETGKVSTVTEEFVLNIKSTEGDYETEWNYGEVDGEVYMESDGQLWVTYKRPIPPKYLKDTNEGSDKKVRFNNTKEAYDSYRSQTDRYRKPKYKSQKPSHIEGDMVVTTNRHGIRKEIPMKNKSYKKSYDEVEFAYSKKHPTNDSFERMLRDSGIYDDEDYGYPRKKGGKKSGYKKKRY